MIRPSSAKISIALVTRNRPESLLRCLRSWRDQNLQPYEIVVSDDSDDHLLEQNKTIAKEFEAKWIGGPRRGLYANRNHAAKACQGSHIRSEDDDHEMPQKHFELSIQAVDCDPSSIWIIGEHCAPVDVHPEVPPDCPGQLQPRGFCLPPFDSQDSWGLADGASIFPRRVFDLGFSYPERFQFGFGYLEFGSLLHSRGFRIRHLETTYIIHHFDAAARSFMSDQIDLESRLFAVLCHSFLYQRTIKNRLLTMAECVRSVGINGLAGIRAIRVAKSAFLERKAEVADLPTLAKREKANLYREDQLRLREVA